MSKSSTIIGGQLLKMSLFFSLLFLISCTNDYKKLKKAPNSKFAHKTVPSIFENKEKATVFNASFSYKDYFASGLMVIKPIKKGHFRIVFTAKMGQTLLDTELTPTDFIIKKSIPQLDRKLFFNILEKDMRLICDGQSGRTIAMQSSDMTDSVFRMKTKKGFRYYYANKENKELKKIERGTKRRKKVVLDLENYQNDFPKKITLAHQNIQLTIELIWIQG